MDHLPTIKMVVAKPTQRIWDLFNKPDPLTDDEWAELELYQALQEEDD